MARFEKDSKMFCMFRDYYILIQEFWETDRSDEFWQQFSNRAKEFIKKYNMEEYPRELVQTLQRELERKLIHSNVRESGMRQEAVKV